MGESIQGERGWEHHHFLCWRPPFSAVLPALDYSSSLGLVSPLGLGGWRLGSSWGTDTVESLLAPQGLGGGIG